MVGSKGIVYFTFFMIFLMGISGDSDLKCYVCTDCEFNYEGTETVCEDTRLSESDKTTALTQDTSVTENQSTVTDETTEPTRTTDSSTTDETACTEVPEITTTVSTVINTVSTSNYDSTTQGELSSSESDIKNSEIEKSSISDQSITGAVSTERYTSTDSNLNNVNSETTTDLYTSEVLVTTSLTLTTEALDTSSLFSQTTASSQTEDPGTTVASITTTSPETPISQDFSSTTTASDLISSTISNENINIIGKGKTDSTTSGFRTTTDNFVSGTAETTVILSSTIESVSSSTPATSLQTEELSTLSSSSDSSTTEELASTESTTNAILDSTTNAILDSTTNVILESTTNEILDSTKNANLESTTNANLESTTNAILESIERQTVINNEPSVLLVDNTKMYGPRQRFIRALQTKQNAESKPRCIVTAYEENNKTVVVRGCSFAREEEENCSSLQKGFKSDKCFVCDTDLCNSASTAVASVLILIVTIFSVSNL